MTDNLILCPATLTGTHIDTHNRDIYIPPTSPNTHPHPFTPNQTHISIHVHPHPSHTLLTGGEHAVSDLLTKCNASIIGHPVQEVLSILTGPMKTGMFLHVNVNPSRQDYTLVCLCPGSRMSPFTICDFVTTTDPATDAVVMHLPEKDNILSDTGFITRYPIANISQLVVEVHNTRTPPEASIKKQRYQLLTQVSRTEKRMCGISRKAYLARVEKKRYVHIHTPPTTRVRGVGSIPTSRSLPPRSPTFDTYPFESIRIHTHPYPYT
jgi:hypothetical protein